MKMLKNLLLERRANPREKQTDFFDYVLEELGKEDTILTETMALDLMFVLLFASFETTSLAITMATKFLSRENPLVLKELTVSEYKLFWNKSSIVRSNNVLLPHLTLSKPNAGRTRGNSNKTGRFRFWIYMERI